MHFALLFTVFCAGKRPQLGRKVSPIVLMMLPYVGVMDPHICGVNREIGAQISLMMLMMLACREHHHYNWGSFSAALESLMLP